MFISKVTYPSLDNGYSLLTWGDDWWLIDNK